MRKNSLSPTQAKPIIATANSGPPTIAIVTTIAIQGIAQAIRARVSDRRPRGGSPPSPGDRRRRRRRRLDLRGVASGSGTGLRVRR